MTGGGRVAWILRVVKTGAEGEERCTDVMEIIRPADLGDIADLGLTLADAKLWLAGLQQVIVTGQAKDHAARRPACPRCGAVCHVKDYRERGVATLFGRVTAASAISLCRMWRDGGWYRLAVALSVDA
jgi:hypothetical protein